PLWAGLSLACIALAAQAIWRRNELDWLLVAFVLTGWSVLAFQALSGAETVSRYYLPSVTLFGAATALALATSTARARRAAIAVGTVLLVLGGPASYWGVRVWAANEREGNALIDRIVALNPATCPVYMGRLESELAQATPILVARGRNEGATCVRGGARTLAARRASKPS